MGGPLHSRRSPRDEGGARQRALRRGGPCAAGHGIPGPGAGKMLPALVSNMLVSLLSTTPSTSTTNCTIVQL